MGVNYMILTMNPNQTIFDADTFIAETQRRWPGCQAYKNKKESNSFTDAGANIDSASTTPFMVYHFIDRHMISVDGDLFDAAEVAAWVRSLLPDSNLDLWLIDNVLSGHTILFPGITPQEVLDNWVDHDEHDPYVEYPQYFH